MELMKAYGVTLLQELAAVLRQLWKTRVIPADWSQSLIILIFKGLNDLTECGKHHKFSIFSDPSKGFVRPHLLIYQKPEKSGFNIKRSTVD